MSVIYLQGKDDYLKTHPMKEITERQKLEGEIISHFNNMWFFLQCLVFYWLQVNAISRSIRSQQLSSFDLLR